MGGAGCTGGAGMGASSSSGLAVGKVCKGWNCKCPYDGQGMWERVCGTEFMRQDMQTTPCSFIEA
jgi:hypothetical protein